MGSTRYLYGEFHSREPSCVQMCWAAENHRYSPIFHDNDPYAPALGQRVGEMKVAQVQHCSVDRPSSECIDLLPIQIQVNMMQDIYIGLYVVGGIVISAL